MRRPSRGRGLERLRGSLGGGASRRSLVALGLVLVLGCEVEAGPAAGEGVALVGGTIVGVGARDLLLQEGRIAAVAEPGGVRGGEVVDVTGRWLLPALIDSHVHLAYLPEAAAMADGGIAAAVDLASPLAFLGALPTAPRMLASGPMLTPVAGYPTQSWGSNGYGLEVADEASARAAVAQLADAGAGVIKLPITPSPRLSDAALRAAVDEAHSRGLKVASHALGADDAALAAAVGADLLAHSPTAGIGDAEAWSGRAVIGSLRAFGGGAQAIDNLRALREAGAVVLYGTDFGNTREAGIDAAELLLMQESGMDAAAALAAATSVPATYWGWSDLGSLEPGKAASLLVLSADPTVDLLTLAAPEAVWLDGVRR